MERLPPAFRVHHDDCLRLPSLEPGTLFDAIYLEPPTDLPVETELVPRLEVLSSCLADSGFLLIHFDNPNAYRAKPFIDTLGLPFKGDIIWSFRQRAVKAKALQKQHGTILVYSANPFYFPKRVPIAQSVVGPSSSERASYPGQKPVELLKRILRSLDDYHKVCTVLDPFMGSGTTLVAAVEQGRSAIGIDTTPEACRIAERRLSETLPSTMQLQLEIE